MFIAHRAPDGREQSVSKHCKNVAKLCGEFAKPFGAKEAGELIGLLHDIGKYSQKFQRRIRGEDVRTDHSTAGAWECFQLYQPEGAFCIAGHHSGLPELGVNDDLPEAPTLLGRMNRGKAGRLPPYDNWRKELTPLPSPRHQTLDPLSRFFFIRMLYSCLVDADRLDTEEFMLGAARQKAAAGIPALDARFQEYVRKKWFPPKNELDRRRCDILEQCTSMGASQSPGLFTLTVPTGGGKTTASLAFALRHAKTYGLTHGLTHGLRRIVYVIPYVSIIEQTAAEFRKILGAENVLEHHSGASYDIDDDKDTMDPERARFLQAAENWDAPIIVTTSVQFFESLYANQPSKCRKLHNLANSVIIFDEAQMLPLSYLRPCVSAIAQLVEHYGATAVLCTATQPALSSLFYEFLPGKPPVELCPAALSSDNIFRRVTFQNAGQLNWDALAEILNEKEQVLCVVNSRKGAQEVYSRLNGEGRFHLSTLMYPAHRCSVLEAIRQRLREGLPCRVVSTSLIEAGVDVDFPVVFREIAGLDSILQAAGRCNREGKRGVGDSVVTIFQAEAAQPALFARAISAAQAVMDHFDDLLCPQAVTLYFQEFLGLSGSDAQDKHKILRQITDGGFPFPEVAKEFRLIEKETRTVYVPLGDGAELVRQLWQGDVSRTLFRKLGTYGVSVYRQHFEDLYNMGALKLLPDGESAVLTNLKLYCKDSGLSLNVGRGAFLSI